MDLEGRSLAQFIPFPSIGVLGAPYFFNVTETGKAHNSS
jgi:hypothetical protein